MSEHYIYDLGLGEWQLNYKLLLKMYIQYVVDSEGIDFLGVYDRRYASDVKFTDNQWAELNRLGECSDAEFKAELERDGE